MQKIKVSMIALSIGIGIGIGVVSMDLGHKEIQKVVKKEEVPCLVWYQIGAPQKDLELVLGEVNKYIEDQIGATLQIKYVDWEQYNEGMASIFNSGENFDLVFTSSWAYDYLKNAQRGAFMPLDAFIETYGKEMWAEIDPRFWEGTEIDGIIYGVPTQKELCSMPMWVFTKEYVDEYNIPYQELHTLQDLEPWLKLIKENEPDVVPLYITGDYSIPKSFDDITHGVGINLEDEILQVQNVFESDDVLETLSITHEYYKKGYINYDAGMVTSRGDVKRFVTKGDGQPYAESVWSRALGYEVVASTIREPIVTTNSVRGAITAVSATSKHPEKAVELLNLINTDAYLRNLLNYGIEGVHYEKIGETTIRLLDRADDYTVPYYMQGNLFKTYVLEGEPEDKWDEFRAFNNQCKVSPILGFDLDRTYIMNQEQNMERVLDVFGKPLYSGSVDPKIYVPKLCKKLEEAGINEVIAEIQDQIEAWKQRTTQ